MTTQRSREDEFRPSGDASSHAVIRRAAERGARSATGNRQFQRDAADTTIDRWEDALLQMKEIREPERWAYRVAANLARSIARRAGFARHLNKKPDAASHLLDASPALGDSENMSAGKRRLIRAMLARRKKELRGRQLEVALKMTEPDMTYHRASKELAMPRYNLKRCFRSVLRRLACPEL